MWSRSNSYNIDLTQKIKNTPPQKKKKKKNTD